MFHVKHLDPSHRPWQPSLRSLCARLTIGVRALVFRVKHSAPRHIQSDEPTLAAFTRSSVLD